MTTPNNLPPQTTDVPARKLAAITGASSGIGAEFARQLAAQGYDLLLTARREERLRALADELEKHYGIHATCLPADLADPAVLEGLEKRLAGLPHLELLVNNAGFGLSGSFAGTDLEKTLAMIQVHTIASVRLAHAVLPGMLRHGRGGIINVASMAAFAALPGSAIYSATKAFLVNFSEALHLETAASGVRVQALCPGFTYSEFHDTPELAGFRRSQVPRLLWCSSEAVVQQSLRDLERGKVVSIPGSLYRLGAWLVRSPLTGGLLKALVSRQLRRSPRPALHGQEGD